jgi:hypothetical protein
LEIMGMVEWRARVAHIQRPDAGGCASGRVDMRVRLL